MPDVRGLAVSLRRSLALLRFCLAVLAGDRRLLLLAVVNGAIAVVIAVAVFAPLGTGPEGAPDGRRPDDVVGAMALAGIVLARVTSTFLNAALAATALARLRGRPSSLREAFALVARRAPAVLTFSLLSAAVDAVAYLVRKWELPGFLAPLTVVQGWLSGLIDTAWQVATFVALPAIVNEGVGAGGSLRRSRELIGSTWGLGVAGVVGLRAAGVGLAAVGILVLSALGSAILPEGASTQPLAIVGGIYVVVLAIVLSGLGQVYRSAVYLYAIGELEPHPDPTIDLRTAFAPVG